MLKLFNTNKKELKKLEIRADQVLALETEYKNLSDSELKNKTKQFKERIANGETLDDLLTEAYATVREASTRFLKMTPFKVQVMGAIVIHEGNIAEMKTGEGKTLTAVMPAYLNALSGDGVHIVTVNEYLARREAEGEIGDLFRYLGLTVGLNVRELTPEEKREVYNGDILYSTNNELGFDYLRDHMVIYKEAIVQRKLNFAIIDEVDSILIDEARTPLIISGGAKNTADLYRQANYFAIRLKEDEDYEIDIKDRIVSLTEAGIKKGESYFNLENLYDVSNVVLLHHINNALKANFIMTRDIDYVVQDGKVVIVDSFTGRLMHGRQFSEGLHQALEAKEAVEIKKETSTLATITFQNYFRMYSKLSGMTGTAKTEEEEFRNIYNMNVVEIPTNEPVIRIDDNDLIFASMDAKYIALSEEIEKRYNFLKDKTQNLTNKPTILYGNNFKGSWYMPGGKSYMAQILNDAGANYYFRNDTTKGTLHMSIESVIDIMQDSDYWLSPSANSMKELKNADKHYKIFKAFKTGKVFNYTERVNANGFNDYWESGVMNPDIILSDIIHILHPDLLEDYKLYYYKQLP